jgi:hypothetical protein
MKAKLYLICLLLFSLLLSACASATPEPAATIAVAPASETASPVIPTSTEPGYHPLSTRTGIPDVDAVLAAVESGDPQQLRDLIHFTTVACTKAEGLGGPPKCQAGEAEGTPVEVLPFLGSEGSFLRASDVSNFPGVDVTGLYAVYKVSDAAYSEEAYPVGEYAVMFVGDGNQPGIVIQIRDGVVRIDYLYSSAYLDETIQRDASELILAPK